MKRGNVRKFGRERNLRKALIRSLETALIEHGRIKTTEAKAKALASNVAKLITQAGKSDIASRRLIREQIGTKATDKLIKDISPKFKDAKGGYTRIMRLGARKSDSAKMVLIELAYPESIAADNQ